MATVYLYGRVGFKSRSSRGDKELPGSHKCLVGSGLVNEIRGRDFGISLERVTHTRVVQIWDTRGCKGKGKGFVVSHWSG